MVPCGVTKTAFSVKSAARAAGSFLLNASSYFTKLHSVRWSESGCDVRAWSGPGRFWTPAFDPLPASGLINADVRRPGDGVQHGVGDVAILEDFCLWSVEGRRDGLPGAFVLGARD